MFNTKLVTLNAKVIIVNANIIIFNAKLPGSGLEYRASGL